MASLVPCYVCGHDWIDHTTTSLSEIHCYVCKGTCRKADPVNTTDNINPSHYKRLTPEPIEVVEQWGLDYHLGSALKYLSRAGHKKDEIQDLEKCIWFIQRKIQKLKRVN